MKSCAIINSELEKMNIFSFNCTCGIEHKSPEKQSKSKGARIIGEEGVEGWREELKPVLTSESV